jgi:hypothetical protein
VIQPAPQSIFVVLSDDDSTGRIAVELDAYARFRVQMERHFADFDAKFAHRAPRQLAASPISRGVAPFQRKPN